MTRARKLKKAIRSRARKTGERYAAARRQVLAARARRRRPRPAATAGVAVPARRPAIPERTAPQAGTPAQPVTASRARRPTGEATDASARRRTGHGFEHWFAVLEALGSVTHAVRARHLREAHDVDGWYAQSLTVAYERARGLRAVNQRMSGRYEVSVSRVVAAPAATVLAALRERSRRNVWVRPAGPELARALRAALDSPDAKALVLKPGGNARLRYPEGATTVEWNVLARGGKARVVVTHMKLASPREVEARRAEWAAVLDALRGHVSGGA